jgi:uncharacterized protein
MRRTGNVAVFSVTTNKMQALVFSSVFTVFYLWSLVTPALGSGLMMKGPQTGQRGHDLSEDVETSSVRIALLGLIKLYQRRVSSVGGPDRCGFRPSCSNYGYEAIKEQGPLIGLVMIGDRQTRCNIFKEPGPDYTLLPNGKLYDPISKNLLFDK